MVIHIKDAGTDALVRELAKRRGIGITAAIKEAVEEALQAEQATAAEAAKELRVRLQPLFDMMDAYPRTGAVADKQFFDDLWDEDDR